MNQPTTIAIIGGGTGTHTVLTGLKAYQADCTLAAIVPMSDSGGSTGRLRDEFGHLPVGDVRMALAALAADDTDYGNILRELFLYRFDRGAGLAGHNVGNLLMTALTELLGSEAAAITAAGQLLRVSGTVIPVTTTPVDLVADYSDGVTVLGEHEIDEPTTDRHDNTITNLRVTPDCYVSPAAEQTIKEADVVVLGPGDLYTSVLANVVIPGVATALARTSATLVYITNLMTKAGQTTNMDAGAHVREIEAYIGRPVDVTLINTGDIPPELLTTYSKQQETPVRGTGIPGHCTVVRENFLATEAITTTTGDVLRRSLIRHDPDTLATAIMAVARQRQSR